MIPTLFIILFALLFIRQVGLTYESMCRIDVFMEDRVALLAEIWDVQRERDYLFDQLAVARIKLESEPQPPRGVYIVPPNVIGEGDVDVRA